MAYPPVPPPTWVRFTPGAPPEQVPGSQVDRYRVQEVRCVRGAPLAGLAPGDELTRTESTVTLPPGASDLIGVLQQLVYMRAAEREPLATTELAGARAVCVLIPMSKSATWWELAADERDAIFRGSSRPGHVEVGRPYARTILRRLYHGRPLPGAGWDFLTYFEFLPERRADFVALLAGLRDPERNPEWNYVERESEVWLARG
jgi:hypothetical protein